MAVPTPNSRPGASRLWLVAGTVVIVAALAAFFTHRFATVEGSISGMPTFLVQEGPLLISIVESGTISARENQVIECEMEGQTQILWLIEEGKHVEKGDLLVRMDSSRLDDQLVDQQIRVQSAEANFIDARENLAITKLNAESAVSAAELKSQFAAEDLIKYIEGDFPLDLKGAEAEVTLAIAELATAEEDLVGQQRLFAKDFVTSRELDASERFLQRAQIDLELARSNIELLKGFTYNRRLTQLESDKEEAERALERARLDSSARVVQADANLKAKESERQRQQSKLAKNKEQIEKCEMYAPTSGMVVYATSGKGMFDRGEPLEEGQMVHERQELIHLPTTNSVMAKITIHESNLAKVRVGLGVRITVDALPDREFTGYVASISQLPDARSMFMNPDLKVYPTEIFVDGDASELRPGMSCLARIMIEHFESAVYVPVQSIVLTKAGSMAYVLNGQEIEERLVEVGLDNNRMIRIASNLEAGELVLLAPPEKPTAIDDDAGLSDTFVEAAAPPEADHQPRNTGQQREGRERRGEGRGRGRMGNMTPEQMQEMRKKYESMSPEEKEEARKQFGGGRMGNMTPEQMQEMRKRYENMSPEDKEKARKQWSGGGMGGMGGRGGGRGDSGSHGQ